MCSFGTCATCKRRAASLPLPSQLQCAVCLHSPLHNQVRILPGKTAPGQVTCIAHACSPSPASRKATWCVQITRLLSWLSRLGRQARRQGGCTAVRAAREASEQVEQTGTSTDQPDGRKQPESGAGTLASSAAGLLLWAAFVGAPSMHAYGACKLTCWVGSIALQPHGPFAQVTLCF